MKQPEIFLFGLWSMRTHELYFSGLSTLTLFRKHHHVGRLGSSHELEHLLVSKQ